MKTRKKERVIEAFGLTFMDCICCGFGAIILLFVLTKVSKESYTRKPLPGLVRSHLNPKSKYQPTPPDDTELQQLEDQLSDLRRKRQQLQERLRERENDLALFISDLEEQQKTLAKLEKKLFEESLNKKVQNRIGEQLFEARQQLTEEMKRLLQSLPQPKKRIIGGIPIDSEYVVFIVDTSGSMRRQWPFVRRRIRETLEIYPKIKGIQIMNDMGQYMFSQYQGQWIPDSPGRRKEILRRFQTWVPFSNSSPVEGIETAIRKFYSQDHKISLYVFGDDFQGGEMESVISTVDRLNRKDDKGGRRVRIHAIGFPGVQGTSSGKRFSTLMRVLCDRNAGTFVGITTY